MELNVNDSNHLVKAFQLHANYLHREVAVEKPGSDLRVVGTLTAFKIKAPADSPTRSTGDTPAATAEPVNPALNPQAYAVSIVVSGLKLKLQGDHVIVLMSEGPSTGMAA